LIGEECGSGGSAVCNCGKREFVRFTIGVEFVVLEREDKASVEFFVERKFLCTGWAKIK
jgi:hypothetical protein